MFPAKPGHLDSIEYVLQGSKCDFSLTLLTTEGELNADLPWFQEQEQWRFRFCAYSVYERPIKLTDHQACIARPFRLDLEAVLEVPPRIGVPDKYEYDTPFPSAGLPGLSKRRRT
jgi:hypothetical protein